MLSLDVRSNIDEVAGWLNRVQKKQLPYATSVALNKTAFDAQRTVKANLQKKFTLRRPFTERGIFQRIGKSRRIKRLYAFERSVRTTPRLGFAKTVNGVAKRKFRGCFEEVFERAVMRRR